MVAVALVAAACSSAGDSVAATVNGESISVADVIELRDSYDENSVAAADFRNDLTRLIFQAVVGQGLADDFEISVDEEAVDARIADFNQAIAENGISRADALGVPGATEALLRREATVFELRSLGVGAVIGEGQFVSDLLTNDPAQITEVCVRHILVATESEAEAVLERLSQGDDFGAVATEVSTDTATPEGDLGCGLASRYVSEFSLASLAAPVGEVFGPIETDFGFHVLIVDGRTTPTAEELAADPLAFVSEDLANSLWTEWFNAKIDAASIEVASEIGTWNGAADGIQPPAAG